MWDINTNIKPNSKFAEGVYEKKKWIRESELKLILRNSAECEIPDFVKHDYVKHEAGIINSHQSHKQMYVYLSRTCFFFIEREKSKNKEQ